MEQETQPQEVQQTEQTSTETTAEPMLEDVYKEFNVTPQTQQTQSQPQQQQQQQQPKQPAEIAIPDPALDPEGHRIFTRNAMNEQNQLKGALRAVAQHLQTETQQRAKAAEEADIKKAVETVSSKLKADPDFTEIAIAQRYKKDPKFKALWDGRGQNPAALEKGLKALANELSQKFEFRVDPQLVENQRAMKEATSTKALGSSQESLNDRLAKATGREFDSLLEQIRNG
jgi:hypothetical protein